ncbi:MAG: helix-turn-helix domain-containing protein [Spirochaetota bacterium]
MGNKDNYLWLKFIENVKNSKPETTAKIFDSLLSVDEKEVIAKRLAAINLIRAGKSYKEIGKILWMSPSTISALKKSIIDAAGYQSGDFYASQSKKEKERRIKPLPERTIFDYWADFPFPKSYGKGRWKYLNYQD